VIGLTTRDGAIIERVRTGTPARWASSATLIAVLVNPNNPAAEADAREMQVAARTIGLQLHLVKAGTESDIDTAFASVVERRAGALLVATDGFLLGRCNQLAALAARHALPVVYSYRQCAVAGGLMSYDASLTDANHQAGIYVGRVLVVRSVA
jgi:putative ABC transport system substrate-binding protein